VNGGLLDEVIWTANTEKVNDLAYLDDLVASSPHYRKHAATKQYEWWLGAWEAVDDPSAVYLKIDDDVVSQMLISTLHMAEANNGLGLFRRQCDPCCRQTVAGEPAIFPRICERCQ
jgi:hypothetical protein